ncbi:phage major capsid protein [Bacillus pacificus]|uniref:phage major capsid protein n=1 Tax=Bacillus pacificus TaxID=2026187 RepID=UPI0021D1CBA6|nr:phage major capsid protein [Bacillus pacificus]MCU5070505.1 phage major capsid protein [Bacillus pacificus]
MEKRLLVTNLECRASEENKGLTISGYAIRYNEQSEPLEYGFREIIKPGAFSESIRNRNILALNQHDNNQLLASTKAKTLRLEERNDGIFFEMDLLPQREELYELVKRGDIGGMSFGFTSDKERFTRSGDTDIREVEKGTLYEISVVHSPAYPTSQVVAKRSLEVYEQFKKENKEGSNMENNQQQNNGQEQRGLELMGGKLTDTKKEVRSVQRGEKFATETSEVTLGGLIRTYVTGKGTEEEKRTLTTSTNGGNFLVPTTIINQLIDKARNKSFLFGNATVVDMQSNNTVTVPRVVNDPTVAFKKQGEVIPKSDPTFDGLELKAKYMYGLVEVPLELVKTGIGVEEKLNHLLAEALNQKLEESALVGATDGFKGIFNDAEILKQEIEKPSYKEISKGVRLVANKNGVAKDLVYSTNNQLDIETETAADGQFLKEPTFYTNMNKFSTNAMDDAKIIVGDLSQIYIGLLQDMQIEVSTHYGFDKGTLAIRIMWYGDVAVAEPKHLCLMNVKQGA